MSHSEEFRDFKRLYYQERLPIKTATFNYEAESGADASVVFEGDQSEIAISGTSEDFVEAVLAVKKTVRKGDEQLIDLTDTPVKDTDEYYDNVDIFIPDSDNPINDAVEQIRRGEADVPENVDLRKALDSSIDLNLDDENLVKVVENYHTCLGMQVIQLKQYLDAFEEHKNSPPITESRVTEYYEKAESILRLEYLTKSPMAGYLSYREDCISDVLFLSNRLLDLRSHSEREWEAIHAAEGGEVKGSFGLYRLLQEYSSLFELMREPFIDLASVVGGERIENINDATDTLSDSEHQGLVVPIVPELRHGPAHFSVEFDDDSGNVNIYNKRARHRVLEKQVSYEESLETYYKMRDLVVAVLYAFVFTEEMLLFEYLQSRDFMFRIIENADAGMFSPA